MSSKEIAYEILRTRRKRTMEIRINQSREVKVYAPGFISEREINRFVKSKAKWIQRKLQEAKQESVLARKRYEPGEHFLFLGKTYPIRFCYHQKRNCRVIFDGSGWNVEIHKNWAPSQREAEVKKKLKTWYWAQAREILGSRVFYYARLLDVCPKTIRIKNQKSIWGSCGYKNRSINLNWKIIMAPVNVVDYIVVHELCHLKVPSHSRRFWREVARAFPDFKERQRWLRQNSPAMQWAQRLSHAD